MKRARILAVPLAITFALTLVACGDDDDDEPDVTATDGTVADDTTADDEAPGITVPDISVPDLSDISIPDISEITLPDITVPDIGAIEDQIRDSLGQIGLSDEQIDCLVDEVEAAGGSTADFGDLTDLFDECDIDLADLGD